MKRRATILARCCVAGAFAATVLATLDAQNGNWFLWGVNCVLLLANAAAAIVNYRAAGKLGHSDT